MATVPHTGDKNRNGVTLEGKNGFQGGGKGKCNIKPDLGRKERI